MKNKETKHLYCDGDTDNAAKRNPKVSDEEAEDILDVRRALAEAKHKGTINARVLWRELNLR
jgi:hypothetical protein